VISGAGVLKQDVFYSVAFSPDGKTFVTGGTPNVILWDPELLTRRSVLKSGRTENIRSLAYSPDGKLLAAGFDDGVVKIWNMGTGKEHLTFTPPCALHSLSFSPDGCLLAVFGNGRHCTLSLWDVTTGKELTKHAD
jgi:WD40 repeat protein